jgi:glutamate dehydrogenase (NADP+)
MLLHRGEDIEGLTATISGSGNVATHAAQKFVELGGKVVSMSDPGGFVHDPDGFDLEKIDWVRQHKTHRRGRISEYAEAFPGATFYQGARPWGLACDVAIPCATQNELDETDAQSLTANGCRAVSEGANMPSTQLAVEAFREAGVLFAPGKAANAGGVAISGLEMSQNAERLSWEAERLQEMLLKIMRDIHERCLRHGTKVDGSVDYVKGANIAGFKRVADAMLACGVV